MDQQLEAQLEARERALATTHRSDRAAERTVKDLQSQIERKEKTVSSLQEDISRNRDKVEKLLKTIDELQASDSSNQLAARRAERELREEREQKLRLERELGAWKGLRLEKGVVGVEGRQIRRSGQWPRNGGDEGSVMGDDELVVGKRRGSGASRQTSLSKGFL
jgi:myosin protein heavy chain